MTVEEMHQYVRGNSPAYEDHHFAVLTDGSGHDATGNSIGCGWTLRCVAVRPGAAGAQTMWRGCCGSTIGNVQRAELSALLEGLQQLSLLYGILDWDNLSEMAGKEVKTFADYPAHRRVPVVWTTDRESLMFQVARGPNGNTLYKRRGDLDLWHRFAFYESWCAITPMHVPRNSEADMEWADAAAGDAREYFVRARRNAELEEGDAILAKEEKELSTTAVYAIGTDDLENGGMSFGPTDDIRRCLMVPGDAKCDTIWKLTPKTQKAVRRWCITDLIWKEITK